MSCHLSFTSLFSHYKTITAANLADIFTSTTTDQVQENSGKLTNTFDAEAVQHELDIQTQVTQTFDTNRQEVKAEINSIIDEANSVLARDPNNQEAQQTIEDMQHLGVLVDSISGALYSPADSTLGTVANTLSPAIVYEIGQHFKEEETQGSAEHILAQTLVAAVTAHLAGNDELSAGLSAGGAEIIAPKLAEWLYGVKDTEDLTSEQKNTISNIISLGSAAIGSTTGNTTDIISSSVAGTVAVEDNAVSVKQIDDNIYKVVTGQFDNDKKIYVVDENGNKTGEILGESLFIDSFYSPEKSQWLGTIYLNSTTGLEFLANQIYTDTPSNLEYALNYQDYNFKGFDNVNAYDGSLISSDIYATARDFGNIGAGYVAGYNGLSWTITKTIFEDFQALKDFKNNLHFTNGTEGSTTVQAEKWGWLLGRKQFENNNSRENR